MNYIDAFLEEIEKISMAGMSMGGAKMGGGMGAGMPRPPMGGAMGGARGNPAMAGVVPMERGGVVKKPTITLLGEKNKKEVVVPVENKPRAKKMIKKISDHYKSKGDSEVSKYIQDTLRSK